MHVKTPNTNSCHFSHSIDTADFLVTPSSYHSGGVNLLYGDGRVAFVTDSVASRIWWAWGSRDGGETEHRN